MAGRAHARVSLAIDLELVRSGDDETPLLLSHPASPQARAFRELAGRLSGVGA